MNYTPQIEFSSPEEIRKLQEVKLRECLSYLAANSPFYKSHFNTHNINVPSIKTLNDLATIPVTTKDDIQKRNWDFLCVARDKVIEYTATSGTLGKPVTIALTENDLQRLGYNESISFACADGSSTDLYQLMLTLDRQFMAGIAYYEGIRKLGAGVVRIGPALPAMQWETIERLQPTVLVAVPSFIIKLLDYATLHQVDWNKTSVKHIVCIGENIRDAALRPNVLAQRITEQWNVQLYGTYASTEMQTAFTECKYGIGGHHHPELIIVELLDDQNKTVREGEVGEVTITTLGIEAMPLLRYKTGDMARMHTSPCACGRTTLRLGPIEGRKQQMLKIKGTTLYPPAILDLLNEVDGIRDFLIEVSTGLYNTDELKIYITANDPIHSEVRNQLTTKLQAKLRVLPEINFVEQAALEKLNGAGQQRKVRKFLDLRT